MKKRITLALAAIAALALPAVSWAATKLPAGCCCPGCPLC